MFFINPLLLLGLFGIAIPIILHLLRKRRTRLIEWGAIRFLVESLMQRRKRVMLEEVLLLATRTLIVMSAALAFARPFISGRTAVPWELVLFAGLGSVVILAVAVIMWQDRNLRRRLWIIAAGLAAFAAITVFAEWLSARRTLRKGGARDIAIVIDGSTSMTLEIDGVSNFDRALKAAENVIQSSPRNTAFALIVAGTPPERLTATPITDRKVLLRHLDSARPTFGANKALDTIALALTTLAQGSHENKQILIIGDAQRSGWELERPEEWNYIEHLIERMPMRTAFIYHALPHPETIRNLSLTDLRFSRTIIGTDRAVTISADISNFGSEAVTPDALNIDISPAAHYSVATIPAIMPGETRTFDFSHRFTKSGEHKISAAISLIDDLPADNVISNTVEISAALKVLVIHPDGRRAKAAQRSAGFLTLALAPTPKAANNFFAPTLKSAADAELANFEKLTNFCAIVLADVPRLDALCATNLAHYAENGGSLLVVNSPRSNSDFYNDWTTSAGECVMPLKLSSARDFAAEAVTLDPLTISHPALQSLPETSDFATALFETLIPAEEREETRVGARYFNGLPFFADKKVGGGIVAQITTPLDPSGGTFVTRQSFLPFVHETLMGIVRGEDDNDFAAARRILADESRLATFTEADIEITKGRLAMEIASTEEELDRALNGSAVGAELWRKLAALLFALLIVEIALTRWIANQRKSGEEGAVSFGA